jgi:cell division protein FtsI/penicillin-binding protein 2
MIDRSKYRIYTVMAILCAAGLVLIGQLIRWQVIEHHRFVARAEAEHQDELVIPARRGEIRDASGYLLAADMVEYDLSVSPRIISNPKDTTLQLHELLNLPRDEVLQILESDQTWVPLTKGLSQANSRERPDVGTPY